MKLEQHTSCFLVIPAKTLYISSSLRRLSENLLFRKFGFEMNMTFCLQIKKLGKELTTKWYIQKLLITIFMQYLTILFRYCAFRMFVCAIQYSNLFPKRVGRFRYLFLWNGCGLLTIVHRQFLRWILTKGRPC